VLVRVLYAAANRRPGKKQRRAETKYRKLGWSTSKIKRALASMQRESNPTDGLYPIIMDLLIDLATEHGEIRAWIHDFTGKVETESYTITKRLQCSISGLADVARELEPDAVVTILRGN
jgi:hypothetical protein